MSRSIARPTNSAQWVRLGCVGGNGQTATDTTYQKARRETGRQARHSNLIRAADLRWPADEARTDTCATPTAAEHNKDTAGTSQVPYRTTYVERNGRDTHRSRDSRAPERRLAIYGIIQYCIAVAAVTALVANPFTTHQTEKNDTRQTTQRQEKKTGRRRSEKKKKKFFVVCRPNLAAASVCMKYPPARSHKRERENFGKNGFFFCATSALLLQRLLGNLEERVEDPDATSGFYNGPCRKRVCNKRIGLFSAYRPRETLF